MKSPHFEIGMTAPEVLVEMVRIGPRINGLSFSIVTPKREPLPRELWPFLPVAELLYHDPSEVSFRLPRKKITLAALDKELNMLEGSEILCVLSAVRRNRGGNIHFHIPLMDFHCENTPAKLERVRDFLSWIGQKGVILFSGNSFHFYGLRLMTKGEWLKFLGKCLLFSEYTDPRYIGHRNLDGMGILRVSPKGGGKEFPRVISVLE